MTRGRGPLDPITGGAAPRPHFASVGDAPSSSFASRGDVSGSSFGSRGYAPGGWVVSVEATSFNTGQFPAEGIPEIAMAGRSNVGKSTLVNAILGSRLAHVGATPGKTRSVNFYLVNTGAVSFRLVDLPGYGYAQRGKAERKEWSRLTSSYVESRGSLVLVCHLADFRHGLLANDRALQEWLSERGRPVMVLFTKADKIAKGKRRAALQQYVRDGIISVDVPIITSGEDRSGVDEARAFMENFVKGHEGA